MDEYRNAIVAGLRTAATESSLKCKDVYGQSDLLNALLLGAQLNDILFRTAYLGNDLADVNVYDYLADLIEGKGLDSDNVNGNADEVYSTEVVVTNMAEAVSKTCAVFPDERVDVIPAPDRTYDLHDEGDHVSLFITTQPDNMPVEFRKKYRLTISEVADGPDND